MVRIHTQAIGDGGELVEIIKGDGDIGRLRISEEGTSDFRGHSVTIGTDPVELVSAAAAEDRTAVTVYNDSSTLIFIKTNEPPNLATGNYITIFSGESVTFTTEKENPISVYGISDEVTANIRVIEVF